LIVLDTGVLYAAADRRDDRHGDGEAFFVPHVDDDFVLPAPAAVETAWLIGTRRGAHAEAVFLSTIGAWGATVIAMLNHRDFRVVRPAHSEAFTLLP